MFRALAELELGGILFVFEGVNDVPVVGDRSANLLDLLGSRALVRGLAMQPSLRFSLTGRLMQPLLRFSLTGRLFAGCFRQPIRRRPLLPPESITHAAPVGSSRSGRFHMPPRLRPRSL